MTVRASKRIDVRGGRREEGQWACVEGREGVGCRIMNGWMGTGDRRPHTFGFWYLFKIESTTWKVLSQYHRYLTADVEKHKQNPLKNVL